MEGWGKKRGERGEGMLQFFKTFYFLVGYTVKNLKP